MFPQVILDLQLVLLAKKNIDQLNLQILQIKNFIYINFIHMDINLMQNINFFVDKFNLFYNFYLNELNSKFIQSYYAQNIFQYIKRKEFIRFFKYLF